MVRKLFNIEEAKKIQQNKSIGKIINRHGNPVRIVCYDKEGDDYPILGLEKVNDKEVLHTYTINGYYNKPINGKVNENDNDIVFEYPDWISFKTGDIAYAYVNDENQNTTEMVLIVDHIEYGENCGAVIIYSAAFIISSSDNDIVNRLFFNVSFIPDDKTRYATSYERKILYDALKKNDESKKSKELLMKIFHKNIYEPACEFEKVLVRNTQNEKWDIDFFKNKIDESKYNCMTNQWKYCISYNDKTKILFCTSDDESAIE